MRPSLHPSFLKLTPESLSSNADKKPCAATILLTSPKSTLTANSECSYARVSSATRADKPSAPRT